MKRDLVAEVMLDKQSFLVSETDEKGIITFANPDFCTIAGYTLEELMGRPHNIVRHPDMPKVAFKDLWQTITSGKIWTGFVKNRCKNGDFYWVYATVYPMKGCEGKPSFMSARRMATHEEITQAETLYKTMR